MKSQYEKKFEAGFAQISVAFKDPSENIKKIERILENTKSDLLVFPELALSGYKIESRRELKKYSQNGKDGLFDNLVKVCREKSIAVVFGFAEAEGKKIYNSSMLIDERGRKSIYRKSHLFFEEKILFDRGDTGFFTSRVKGANVGMIICFDWFFPEAMRTLALMKADIIAHPSNLVMPYCQDAMKTRCLENRVFAVTSNRIGKEKDVIFTGRSQITGVKGNVIESALMKSEQTKTALIDINDARSKKINRINDLFKDRRKDLYVL